MMQHQKRFVLFAAFTALFITVARVSPARAAPDDSDTAAGIPMWMLGILAADDEDNDCTTYYYDSDNDGYGTTSSQCLSSPTGFFTSTNANDCFDSNADANPAQAGYFSIVRGDGSYDYNCDGTESRRYNSIGACSGAAFTCTTSRTGWQGNTIPSCGSSSSYITSCDAGFLGCSEVTIVRTQSCR